MHFPPIPGVLSVTDPLGFVLLWVTGPQRERSSSVFPWSSRTADTVVKIEGMPTGNGFAEAEGECSLHREHSQA